MNNAHRIAQIFVFLLMITTLAFPAMAAPSTTKAHNPLREKMRELKTMRSEMNALTLLNKLQLNKDQQKSILDLAKQAQTQRRELPENSALNKALDDTRNTYTTLLEQIKNGATPSEDLQQKAKANRKQLGALLKEFRAKTREAMNPMEEKLKTVLTAEQIKMVEAYSPKSMRKHARHNRHGHDGRKAKRDPVARLESVREIPADQWEARKEIILQRYEKILIKRAPELTAQEIQNKKNSILEIAEKARAMSDEEFSTAKQDLAKQLVPAKAGKRKKQGKRDKKQKGSKLCRLLLNERMIPLLEARL